MTDIIIRPARPGELKIVQDLNHELFLSDQRHFGDLNLDWPYQEDGEEYFTQLVNGESGVCYVAEVEGKVIGYAAGGIMYKHSAYNGKRAELENMFVKAEYRSQGIGGKLVDAFFAWAKSQQADMAVVNAFSPNTQAIAFYEHAGFEPYSVYLMKKL